MDSLEISGRTVEEATQEALSQLGASLEEVEVTVVKEGKSGILGIGGDEAVVRVTRLNLEAPVETGDTEEADDATGIIRQTVEQMLELLDVPAAVSISVDEPSSDDEDRSVFVDIDGDDLGILIGRRGQTLASLQYIIRLIIGHQTATWLPITVDVEGYKQRRNEGLQEFALQMAEQVVARNAPFSLEPMPAYERRLVHMCLADNPDVVTESMGVGDSRRVVILPKGTAL